MSHMGDEPTAEIHVRPNGSLKVYGNVRLVDVDGNPYDLTPWTRDDGHGARIKLCRCGRSETMPFCDGSHVAAGFTSEPRTSDDITPETD